MIHSEKKFARGGALVVLASAVFACSASANPPTQTVWRFLGIPQSVGAMKGARDRLVNRSGNHPQRERTPQLKRLADPANLEAENPAIKAAAEIKAEEDLAPQKIKALKYLATVGCGCYDKDGKIEEALLAGLNDCTEEVRIEAANAVRAAAGTCRCTYDGCTPTCCRPSIVKRLDEMAYGVDDDGCHIEPSREVRTAAARARSACSAVPQKPEAAPDTPKPEVEPLPKPKKKGGGKESLPPPPEDDELDSPEAPPSADDDVPPSADDAPPSTDDLDGSRSQKHRSVELVQATSDASQSTTANWYPVAESVVPENVVAPENMVVARFARRTVNGRVLIRMNREYDLNLDDSLLVLTLDGNSIVTKVMVVDGESVEIGGDSIDQFNFTSSPTIFVGLIGN